MDRKVNAQPAEQKHAQRIRTDRGKLTCVCVNAPRFGDVPRTRILRQAALRYVLLAAG